MNFTVAVDVMAYLDVNDLLSQYHGNRADMLAAFHEIVAELSRDAHQKGAPIGSKGLRRFDRRPLRAYFVIEGTKARIREFRRSRP